MLVESSEQRTLFHLEDQVTTHFNVHSRIEDSVLWKDAFHLSIVHRLRNVLTLVNNNNNIIIIIIILFLKCSETRRLLTESKNHPTLIFNYLLSFDPLNIEQVVFLFWVSQFCDVAKVAIIH
jgi:hypothetical protein